MVVVHQYPNEPFEVKSDETEWLKLLIAQQKVMEINDILFLYNYKYNTVYVCDLPKTFIHLMKYGNLIEYKLREVVKNGSGRWKTISKKPPMLELSLNQFNEVEEIIYQRDLKFKDVYLLFQDHLNLPDIYNAKNHSLPASNKNLMPNDDTNHHWADEDDWDN